MILSGIGKRYAVTLFNVAKTEGVAEQVSGDIVSFANLFASESGFRNFLMSPLVLTADKKELIDTVIGERASGLFVKFAALLIDKKRLGKIQKISDAYTFLYEQEQGIVEINAVTAIPLDPDLITQTRRTLEKYARNEAELEALSDEDRKRMSDDFLRLQIEFHDRIKPRLSVAQQERLFKLPPLILHFNHGENITIHGKRTYF